MDNRSECRVAEMMIKAGKGIRHGDRNLRGGRRAAPAFGRSGQIKDNRDFEGHGAGEESGGGFREGGCVADGGEGCVV